MIEFTRTAEWLTMAEYSSIRWQCTLCVGKMICQHNGWTAAAENGQCLDIPSSSSSAFGLDSNGVFVLCLVRSAFVPFWSFIHSFNILEHKRQMSRLTCRNWKGEWYKIKICPYTLTSRVASTRWWIAIHSGWYVHSCSIWTICKRKNRNNSSTHRMQVHCPLSNGVMSRITKLKFQEPCCPLHHFQKQCGHTKDGWEFPQASAYFSYSARGQWNDARYARE